MAKRRYRKYDDEELVLALAAGEKTHAQIARDFGLSRSMVASIARGERRPMLHGRIQAASASFRDRGGRLASRMVAPAIGRLVQMIGPDSDAPPEVQRRAAADILKFACGSGSWLGGGPPHGIGWEAPGSLLSNLPANLRGRVLDELGAPPDGGQGDEDA